MGLLCESPCTPAVLVLNLIVVPVTRSRRKASSTPLVSPATRSVPWDGKATYRPSPLMWTEPKLPKFASPPDASTLTRVVVPVTTSRTNVSDTSFASPGTRSEATDVNATYRPSSETEFSVIPLPPFASPPKMSTLTRVVVPATRSRRKTSDVPFASPGTRSSTPEVNTT